MRTAKTLIRLGGCPGWSESLLGAHAILLVLSWGGSNDFIFLNLYWPTVDTCQSLMCPEFWPNKLYVYEPQQNPRWGLWSCKTGFSPPVIYYRLFQGGASVMVYYSCHCSSQLFVFLSCLVIRAGCGIWLYQFLIIAFLSTFQDIFLNISKIFLISCQSNWLTWCMWILEWYLSTLDITLTFTDFSKFHILRAVAACKGSNGISNYRNDPKFSDTQKMCCNHSKVWTMWLYHRVMSPWVQTMQTEWQTV